MKILNFFKKGDLWFKVLSLLFALACWFFVMGINDPEIEMTVRKVPVNYSGEGIVANSQNLQIISGRAETIDVRVRGARSDLLKLKSSDIVVNANVADVEEPGTYKIDCNVQLPSSDLQLADKDKLYVSLFIDSLSDVDVPVIAEINGETTEGCILGAARLSPATVRITGPSTEVNTISHALIQVKTGVISESFFGEYSYKLVSYDGTDFQPTYSVKKTNKISVNIPVHIQKTVPLSVSLHELGALSEQNVSVEITPKEITLAGERSALESISSISVGTIPLADVTDSGYKATLPLNIPDGIVNVSEITEAEVRITLKNITSKSFTVTRFKLINTPEGTNATLLEKEKQITLRGSEEFLSGLKNTDICLVLDMSTVSSSTGRKNVVAEVVVDNTNGGFIPADTYKVPVRLEKK